MKKTFKQKDELEIIVLMQKIKIIFLNILLQIFRKSKLFLTAWKQLLVIILLGVFSGYLSTDAETPLPKEATVLVKINFDAGNFVYDAVDLINLKISSGDKEFFIQEMKLNFDEKIDKVSVSPVIDIKDIMAKDIKANEIRVLFENIEYEDGLEVADGFKSDYDYHFIKAKVSENSSIQTINKIVDYFNNNPLFKELKERNIQRISSIISDNEQTINQIDKLIEHYTSQDKTNSSQLYIDNKDISPNDLIATKILLQSENQELKKESLISKQTVMMINEANVMIEDHSLLSNKMIFYPIVFLLFYVFIMFIRSTYSYLDKLDTAS